MNLFPYFFMGVYSVEGDTPAESFPTLLLRLSTIVRNTCRADGATATFTVDTTPTYEQAWALDLLREIME